MATNPNGFDYFLNGEPFGALKGTGSTTNFDYALQGEPLFALISPGEMTYTDTGTGVLVVVGSGVDAAILLDSGSAISIFVGGGADAPEYADAGTGMASLFGAGADVAILVDVGGGVLIAIGSGTDDLPPPPTDSDYIGDTTIYDLNSPTGSIGGGIVLDSEYIYDT